MLSWNHVPACAERSQILVGAEGTEASLASRRKTSRQIHSGAPLLRAAWIRSSRDQPGKNQAQGARKRDLFFRQKTHRRDRAGSAEESIRRHAPLSRRDP